MTNNNVTLGQAKLSELEISNVAIQKAGTIQFVKKSPRYGANKKPIDGSCAKIVCEFVDSALTKILEKVNADVSQLKTTTLDIIGDEQDLLGITTDDLLDGELPLYKAKVMLKWDFYSSSRKGLKLVVNLDDLKDKEGKENG